MAGVFAVVLAALVLLEPAILEAPFQNARTVVFTGGGTVLAAVALAVMLHLRIPVTVRLPVLIVPFLVVNWWLLSPFFLDEVVDEEFSTSIAEQQDLPPSSAPTATGDEGSVDEEAAGTDATGGEPADTELGSPVLLGSGRFRGLAGHEGTGDAGFFRTADGSHVLRFENFDIENGPDLEVYWIPGAGRTSLVEGSVHLGALKGNVGDQSYALPPETEVPPGDYTALVWCEAFSVEFVGATLTID